VNSADVNPRVLAQLYLHAVLPCLSDLAVQDPQVRSIMAKANVAIAFKVLGGDSATLDVSPTAIRHKRGVTGPSVVMLFLSNAHLNAFFSGKKWALPILAWGGWRIGALSRFAKLAAILEKVLNGDTEVLASEAGRRCYTRLSLIAAVLGLECLAQGDERSEDTLRSLPNGMAAFLIKDEEHSTAWFEHGTNCKSGWSDPPRRPDVTIVFGDIHTAYGAMHDDIDTMAAIGSGSIKIEGLIPLADGLNAVMERMRVYLQP
jgi:hypothetical protein